MREFSQELKEWREKIAPPEKPKGRYMQDVRHPLKPRPLDDRPGEVAKGPRKPYEPKPEVPKEAPCSKCGKSVALDRWWYHECFGTRFVR